MIVCVVLESDFGTGTWSLLSHYTLGIARSLISVPQSTNRTGMSGHLSTLVALTHLHPFITGLTDFDQLLPHPSSPAMSTCSTGFGLTQCRPPPISFATKSLKFSMLILVPSLARAPKPQHQTPKQRDALIAKTQPRPPLPDL